MTASAPPDALWRRPALLLSLLFVAGLCASIAWQWRTTRVAAPTSPVTLTTQEPHPARSVPGHETTGSRLREFAGTGIDDDVAPGHGQPDLPVAMSEADRADLETATVARDVDTRVMAILELRDAYSAESIDALGGLLSSDHEPRVRVAAAESLRILAANDADRSGRIRVLLQGALYDADRSVTEQARRALAEIESLQ
jgi:hypothetical protein